MIILLPDAVDGLQELEARLSVETLEAWVSTLAWHEACVEMPKFKVESECHLEEVLQQMGMVDLFHFPEADLTGVAQPRELFLSKVIHKAVVEVEEEGTKAAAATAAVMYFGATELSEPLTEFRADHPFLFLIRHNASGSILFMGRVLNPLN